MPLDAIPLAEYQARRQRVLDSLNNTAAIVFAGEGSPPLLGKWRPDQHFVYLTGLDSEPGAAVLFDPANENPRRRVVLLLRPLNPEAERWDGYRDTIGQALRDRTGFDTVMRSNVIPAAITTA